MPRFLHSSDLHLGKPFGQLPAELAGRLTEARQDAIGRLAAAARDAGAAHILLAGDTWDSEAPSDRVLRHALEAMAAESGIHWYLLPGNHDRLREGGLWERIAADCPANLHLLLDEAPVPFGEDAVLLPTPCRSRDPGRDVSAWMDGAASPEGLLRIGIAHGSVVDFTAEDARATSAAIDPARARRAGLAYLALGDWHGCLRIDARTWYAGSPEPDRFREDASPGTALSVATESAEAVTVERLPIARFTWLQARATLRPGEPPAPALAALLPGGVARRDLLLALRLAGRAPLAEREAWAQAVEALAPSLAHCVADFSAVETLVEPEDLDRIDRAGALRVAAEALAAEADNDALELDRRAAARDALRLLYSWSVEDTPDAAASGQ